jgi:WD40 repeat protein
MPTSFDFVGVSHEIWVSDHNGMIHHIDIREAKKLRRYQLSSAKIGCVSVNPAFTHTLLCASNDRTLKLVYQDDNNIFLSLIWRYRLWDARKLQSAPLEDLEESDAQADSRSISVAALLDEQMNNFLDTSEGKDTMRAEWTHGKSVSSAYWSPFGNQIVSTSYDDHLRRK